MVLANTISDLILTSLVRETQAGVVDLFQRTAERVSEYFGQSESVFEF